MAAEVFAVIALRHMQIVVRTGVGRVEHGEQVPQPLREPKYLPVHDRGAEPLQQGWIRLGEQGEGLADIPAAQIDSCIDGYFEDVSPPL